MSREDPVSESLRRGLRELAAADAPGLVAEARARARVRAQALIEDALVDELVAAASRLRDGSPRPAPEAPANGSPRPAPEAPATAPRPDESAAVWWAYCVASAGEYVLASPELEGVEPGSDVQVVREGPLAALVSRVPANEYGDERLREHLEDLEWLERTARRHEAVLEAALQEVTIVPLRLCTLYRDLDGVRRLLRDYARTFSDGLNRVEGCVEWGLKVFAEARAAAGLEPREETTERSGAAYLKQRQEERALAERAGEVRAKCAEVVHARMSEVAREAASNPPQRPELHGRELRMLLNGAYLVERARDEELVRTVEGLREEWEPLGFMIELTGPWPPYNFVSDVAGVMP